MCPCIDETQDSSRCHPGRIVSAGDQQLKANSTKSNCNFNHQRVHDNQRSFDSDKFTTPDTSPPTTHSVHYKASLINEGVLEPGIDHIAPSKPSPLIVVTCNNNVNSSSTASSSTAVDGGGGGGGGVTSTNQLSCEVEASTIERDGDAEVRDLRLSDLTVTHGGDGGSVDGDLSTALDGRTTNRSLTRETDYLHSESDGSTSGPDSSDEFETNDDIDDGEGGDGVFLGDNNQDSRPSDDRNVESLSGSVFTVDLGLLSFYIYIYIYRMYGLLIVLYIAYI